MTIHRYGRRFFEVPHFAVFLIITANIIVYTWYSYFSVANFVPSELLFRREAVNFFAVDRYEYWRLFTRGFLHANLLHLAINMFCLAFWGGHLERRVGSLYFLTIYISALILSAIVSIATLSPQYQLIGSSGAISGIFGALLCLVILDKIHLPAITFVISIGSSAALLALNPGNVGWGFHLGGFAAGMIFCALLDGLERLNALVFRCKFPEFIKLNGCVVVVGLAVLLWNDLPIVLIYRPEGWLFLLTYSIACFGVIKLIDLVLSVKKGLAITVIAFSVANAALVLFAGVTHAAPLTAVCRPHLFKAIIQVENVIDAACANINVTVYVAAMCVLFLTILIYFHSFFRGITDVGFVGATLRAERERRRGI